MWLRKLTKKVVGVTSRKRRGGVLVATRIHLPEAAAASFRLDGVERALTRHHVPVRVLTTTAPARKRENRHEQDSPGLPYRAPQGVSVSRWPVLRDSTGYLRGYIPYMSFDLPLFGRLLAQSRPDAILVEPPPTTGAVVRLVATLRRIPYVWYAPDVWSVAAESTGAPQFVLSVVRSLESFAMRGAARVIAINSEVESKARELGAREVVVVPNGIDTSVFDVDGPIPSRHEREALGITGPYAVYAGTASEWQDAGVFIRALARVRQTVPHAQLLYLGQGSDWQVLTEAAQRIPPGVDGAPAVVMHGLMSPEDAARWQRGAVCALVSIKPGLGYDFAYPTKVLAALACGTPVLYAGRGPVVSDIDSNMLGWACEHDENDVAQAMIDAFTARQSLGEGNRAGYLHQWVRAHRSLHATGEAVAKVLREVVLEDRRILRACPIMRLRRSNQPQEEQG